MKKLKVKNLIVVCCLFSCFVPCKSVNAYAESVNTFQLKGFDIKDFNSYETYVVDGNDTQIVSFGDKVGHMSLYTACAKLYNDNNKSMYYFIMSEASICAYTKDSNNVRYVNKDLELSCYSTVNNANLIKYTPESYGNVQLSGTESISISMSKSDNAGITIGTDISASVGESAGGTASLSFSQTYQSSNVIMTPDTILSEEKKQVVGAKLDFRFQNYDDAKLSKNSPYRGNTIFRTVHIFEIKNFDYSRDIFVSFIIEMKGTFAKLNTHSRNISNMSKYLITNSTSKELKAAYYVQRF